MSVMQFLRIFWAWRWLVVAATVSSLVGALIVVSVLPPRWEAHTRVMLSLLKPDPVTGQVMGNEGRLYAATQIELITDFSTAEQVIDQLGWSSDPQLIAAYSKRPKSDQRDFKTWLSQLVIDGAKAKLVQDSDILEISYTASTAANARAVVDALRKAYIDSSLSFRREDAERNAEWFEQQSSKAKAALDQAVSAESTFEKANGIVMASGKQDEESARLQGLMQAGGAGVETPPMVVNGPTSSAASQALIQLDAQIAEEQKILGPNNPQMQALRAHRGVLVTLAAQENASPRAAARPDVTAAYARAIAAQKDKVIADSGKIGQLTELQNDVDLRRDELARMLGKVAQYREEALVGDAGITPLGKATTPPSPTFPNYPLVIVGALVLGAGLGLMVALLIELLWRRVRGAEDLSALRDMPLVGVVGAPSSSLRSGLFSWRPRWLFPLRRRGMSPA